MNRAHRTPPTARLASVTTGRRSSWAVLLLSFLLAGLAIGLGSTVSSSGDAPNSLPDDAESARVAQLQQEFEGADVVPAIAVFARDGDPLIDEDLAAVGRASERFAAVVGAEVSPPTPAPDGEAAIVSIPVSSDLSGFNLNEVVGELRDAAAEDLGSSR